jgi:hypothetical protein
MNKPSQLKKRKWNANLSARGSTSTAYLMFSALLVTTSFAFFMAQARAATSFDRLSSLLAATPEGGWVKASTNFYRMGRSQTIPKDGR